MKKYLLIALVGLASCNQKKSNVLVVGFVDAFQDNTIEQAKVGFIDALKKNGFDKQKGNVKITYWNTQGNFLTLTQIVNYFISEKVTLIATNASLATITAIQKTKTVPIFMMVAPTPALMKVQNDKGEARANLSGVADDLE